MRTLPQILEGQYGYKLFILGRDSLPGEGTFTHHTVKFLVDKKTCALKPSRPPEL